MKPDFQGVCWASTWARVVDMYKDHHWTEETSLHWRSSLQHPLARASGAWNPSRLLCSIFFSKSLTETLYLIAV